MFVILLKFTERKDSAPQLLAAHNEWIQRGLDEGVFVLVGGLRSKTGGAILAMNTSMEALQARVKADPFVAEGVVIPGIEEILPNRVDEQRLSCRRARMSPLPLPWAQPDRELQRAILQPSLVIRQSTGPYSGATR